MAIPDFKVGGDGPVVIAAAVTPDDDTDLSWPTRGVYIGGAGDLEVHMVGDDGTPTAVVFSNLVAGQVYPFSVRRILAGNTTATGIVALK